MGEPREEWIIKRASSFLFYGMVPWWLSGKEFVCQCRKCGFDPWVGKIPWRRKWQPMPVFLPGKSHGAWWAAMESMRLKTYDLMTKNNNLALACVKKKIYHEDENSGERLGSLQESP